MAVKITKFIMSAEYGTPIRSRTATKGLSNTPASEIGNNADKTTIVPTKKDDQSPQSSSNGTSVSFFLGSLFLQLQCLLILFPKKQN